MKRPLLLLFAAAALVSSCKQDDGTIAFPVANYAGFVYTSTNDSAGNGIIALGRKGDGTVTELPGSPYLTGGAGDAADGDFDTQWALRIVGDYLLAVNAGANPTSGSISVFKINHETGGLKQVDQNLATPGMDNMDSHGIRAVSLAATTIGGSTWVVVGNQHSNPSYQNSPAQLMGTVVTSPLRNLAVFTLDPTTGVLSFRSIGATYESGQNGGPVTVEFNPDGTKLAVSTWGIIHGGVDDPDLTAQKPGRLYVYSFAGGTLTQTGMFEEVGKASTTGVSWSPNGQYIYLTNANLNSSKENNGLVVHDGTTAAKLQNFPTADRNDAACWTLVSRDHTKVYTASFAQNVVSAFDIGTDGRLSQSLRPNFFARGGNIPARDTKDMYEASGYLYVLGAGASHSVTTFKTSATGALTETPGSPYRVPSSAGKTDSQHAYLGLTGFEK